MEQVWDGALTVCSALSAELWWWDEASSKLHGARDARHEHVSRLLKQKLFEMCVDGFVRKKKTFLGIFMQLHFFHQSSNEIMGTVNVERQGWTRKQHLSISLLLLICLKVKYIITAKMYTLLCKFSVLLSSVSQLFFLCHCSPRGPGGRGPWPNPNTNSVSHNLLQYLRHHWECLQWSVSYVLLHFGSILSTDSIFIFISRQLCGKCFVMALMLDHRL